ncbi:Hypothetical_protein [Hexamita inflata]|uniref:Hypothetical_protein n=1 Tax=Hexamita inflata TaxID=28002 RepID=A0AA86NDM1_9EUKA|nr:Hypothetical protein HINF_LOCUS4925 [Hexamita inflata]
MSVLMRRENTLIIEPGSDISKIQIINFILLPNSKKHFEGPPLYLQQNRIQLIAANKKYYNDFQEEIQIEVQTELKSKIYQLMESYIQRDFLGQNQQQLHQNQVNYVQNPQNQYQNPNPTQYQQNSQNAPIQHSGQYISDNVQVTHYPQIQQYQNIPPQTVCVQPVQQQQQQQQQYQQPQQFQAQSVSQQTALQQVYQHQIQQNSVQQIPFQRPQSVNQQPLAAQQLYQQPQAQFQPQPIIHPTIPTYQQQINQLKQETTQNPPVFPTITVQIPAQQVQVQQKEPKNDQKQVQIEPKKEVKEQEKNENEEESIVIEGSSISIDLEESS